MTFRSSWSAERREGHAGRQRRPSGPGDPVRPQSAGPPGGGSAPVRVPTGATHPPRTPAPAEEAWAPRRGRAPPSPRPGDSRRRSGPTGSPGRDQRSLIRAGPHRRVAAASPWLRPRGTTYRASRSRWSAVCGSRPEVARGNRLRRASWATSARHLRPSPGNPGSEGGRESRRARCGGGASGAHAQN